jgi:hypothetical protein
VFLSQPAAALGTLLIGAWQAAHEIRPLLL